MRWEDIQRTLRFKLGELFSRESSIRALVRDVDSTLEAFVIWQGSAVDCWSEILRQIRIRHLELDLIDAAQMVYPHDEALQKAKADFNALNLGARATSTPASVSSSVAQTPTQSSQTPSNRKPDGTGPIKVFISYAEEDEKFKKQLEIHLAMLRRDHIIDTVDSQLIEPGLEWERETAKSIASAQVILLLVSPYFLAPDEIHEHVIKPAMLKQEQGTARVIPIKLRPYDAGKISFQKLQGLPRDGRPIEAWRSTDEAWSEVARSIRQVCEGLRSNTENH